MSVQDQNQKFLDEQNELVEQLKGTRTGAFFAQKNVQPQNNQVDAAPVQEKVQQSTPDCSM